MRRKKLEILLGFVISILVTLSATPQVLAQCNLLTKVVLTDHTDAQPGLTASGDRLVLTWAGSSDGAFNSMISFDGVNWSNKVLRLDFPRIALGNSGNTDNPGPSGGLGMTDSPPCGGMYAAWRDNINRMWATKSGDGINWETPRLIINPSASASLSSASVSLSPATTNLPCWDCCPDCPPPPPPPPPPGIRGTALSAPALRGDDGSLPIGFAFTTPHPLSPRQYAARKGKFNCDFSNIVFPIQESFFDTPGGDQVIDVPGTPGWSGASGTAKVSAIATGPPGGFPAKAGQIIVQVNNDLAHALGFNWTNNGVMTAVNPNDGTPYIAWTCHPDFGDTCRPDRETVSKINIQNLRTGAQLTCADWSIYNPAMAFFQGKIWIAWRGRDPGQTGYLNVASLYPF